MHISTTANNPQKIVVKIATAARCGLICKGDGRICFIPNVLLQVVYAKTKSMAHSNSSS